MTDWDDALRIAELLAVDPGGLGGIVVRSGAGPVRDRFMARVSALLPADRPFRRMPATIADDRLLGGLDLAATLGTGRPVASRGLLAEADGGVVVVAMAERLPIGASARLSAALDTGRLEAERDGFTISAPARFGIVALDEGQEDERPPASLIDRLAFRVELDGLSWNSLGRQDDILPDLRAASARLDAVTTPPELLDALSSAALALGVWSLRAVTLAVRVARAAAALAGRDVVSDEDAAEAARFVLSPRATRLPAPPGAQEPEAEDQPETTEQPDPGESGDEESDSLPDADSDMVLDAARAAIPADLLARLAGGAIQRSRAGGRAGAAAKAGLKGRPAGNRPGKPRDGARLDVLATLRAAAPMQRLRGAEPGRIAVRAADFRIVRRIQKPQTTTIFAVDASGSSALNRLAEAKGAVELLLAECYVRRDRVALVSFRGRSAEVMLPPTSSLTRARRGLAGLPGGGGTPLASALDAVTALAESVRRQDGRAVIVMLTDGRANVTRDGAGNRARATAEAEEAGKSLRALDISSLLIDTSPRASDAARALAAAMGALYLPLPMADASAMARAIRAASA